MPQVTQEKVQVHYGRRSFDGSLKDEGRREVARAVLTHSDEDKKPLQLLFELETYTNNRGVKEYTLHIYKIEGDDLRTKSRVTEKNVRETDRGLISVEDKGNMRELGQYCYEFSHYSPEERFNRPQTPV